MGRNLRRENLYYFISCGDASAEGGKTKSEIRARDRGNLKIVKIGVFYCVVFTRDERRTVIYGERDTVGEREIRMVTISPDSSVVAATAVVVAVEDHEMFTWISAMALVCWTWYFFILLVQGIGIFQLYVKDQLYVYAKYPS
jgi:hypothetical protein